MPRAIRFHQTGGPEVLALEDTPLPPIGPEDVHLRHRAIGVNYIDTYHRSGLYPLPGLPSGLGLEGAGEVVAVGAAVSDLAPGDRVAYGTGPLGAYADEVVVPAAKLVKLPPRINHTQAAGMMLRGMTVAYLLTRTFRVEAGMPVLVHAAAGGVGLIAGQWLRHLGATPIGTVGSAAKVPLAAAHGYAHVIDLSQEDLKARVHEITDGAGVPVVYDGVGKALFEDSLDCLARLGTMVTFGNASGAVPPLDPLTLTNKGSLFLTRPKLMDYTATRAELEGLAQALFQVVESGAVRIEVGQTYPLAEAARAHADLEGRRTTGSTILLP
ncbi:quinone oxidoreductase family protein [Roseospirillum parvum]|uniref:NADPH2:quinone reductase n=1 Tax=Roseospirillum parvum TaxID=83401 RepID=A0A1G8DRW9_9PROT|nr:quinone oxidoreductase [Roseospirillum parvum]SDH60447.1 NADPH2:quinone reductase [Roseospirillum parvum]